MRGSERDEQFTAFVAARRAHLRRTAYLLCGDWHQAEDLVQMTLAKVYVAWPRLYRDSTPDAFTRRTLIRTHIDETRRPWHRTRAAQELTDQPEPEGLAAEDRDALLSALRDLPDGQRRAVVLRHWLGLSVEETARDLGCSTGTVKSQTARAVHRLREALGESSPPQEDDYERAR
jgi:RNA polymerase sigma-70 factor (sigma-E family)